MSCRAPVIIAGENGEVRGGIVLGSADTPVDEGGNPTMGATIQSNGGDINFYGQSKLAGTRGRRRDRDSRRRGRRPDEPRHRGNRIEPQHGVDMRRGPGHLHRRGQHQLARRRPVGRGQCGCRILRKALGWGRHHQRQHRHQRVRATFLNRRTRWPRRCGPRRGAATFSVGEGSDSIRSGISASTGDISLVGSSRDTAGNTPRPPSSLPAAASRSTKARLPPAAT